MKALVLDAELKTAHVQDISPPTPGPNDIRVHVCAVALNPVDSLYVYNPLGSSGRVIGSDFAGVIDALGNAVPAQELEAGTGKLNVLKIGQRVAGFLQGACSVNERPGAFGEHLVCPWDLVWKVPDNVPLEHAVTISLCALTAAQALFFRMRFPAPFQWCRSKQQSDLLQGNGRVCCFVYGASTSVGMYAAQLFHHAVAYTGRKLRLIGTASPKHFNMLYADPYSYDHLVSYRDPDWPRQIINYCAENGLDGIDYAYDCISEGSTVSETAKILVPRSGKMAIVRSREGGAWSAQALRVEPSYGAVWEGLGEEVQYQGMHLPASKEARAFAVSFYKYLSTGHKEADGDWELKLQPNRVRLMPGGLDNIVGDGLSLLGTGSMDDRGASKQRTEEWMRPVSAEKLVYRIPGVD